MRSIVLLVGLGWLAATSAWAEDAALVRGLMRNGEPLGAAFLLEVDGRVAAAGAAHSFDGTKLAESGLVVFRLGREGGGAEVARATRYFAPPGRSFSKPGATLRDDHVSFVLDAPPEGAAVLRPADALPAVGDRVEVLAHAGLEPIPGRVAAVSEDAIEVDLFGGSYPQMRARLNGAGGAPLVPMGGGPVLGLLQNAKPHAGRVRAGFGPIGGLVASMRAPYEEGQGRLFATLAPQASAANSPADRRRQATGSAFGDVSSEDRVAELVAEAARPELAARRNAARRLLVEIQEPRAGARLGADGVAFISGRALALRAASKRFDIVIVIDTSQSTERPVGVDVDENGIIGVQAGPGDGRSTDPGDSILAAEAEAARKLIEGLDMRATRVAIVTFSGFVEPFGRTAKRATVTWEPLTSNFKRLDRALDEIVRKGPAGGTYMSAGVDVAALELAGLEGAISQADPESEKVVLFLTDGTPTLPYGSLNEVGNLRSLFAAALRARDTAVRVHSFAIGPEAVDRPLAAVELAEITGGEFTAVGDPARLTRFMEATNFAHIDEVSVRNATAGRAAYSARNHADGSFDALVPLVPGENELVVTARSSDGDTREDRVVVFHEPGGGDQRIPVELLPKKTELLSRRLEDLELERVRQLRKELVIEMDRERAAAEERARVQRKELRIEAEELSVPDADPARSPSKTE